ncbi:MAG: hypothetical protein GOV02_01395 [Candidatus Aenigmarchaeota archaeon]|nr:hypothetical protein [Candidatus Aenigmarchaeota archaeon]
MNKILDKSDEEQIKAQSMEIEKCIHRKDDCQRRCPYIGHAKDVIYSKYESEFEVENGFGLSIEPVEHEYHIAIEKKPVKCVLTIGSTEYLEDDFKKAFEGIEIVRDLCENVES